MLRSPAFASNTLYNFNIENHPYKKVLFIELPLVYKFITLTKYVHYSADNSNS